MGRVVNFRIPTYLCALYLVWPSDLEDISPIQNCTSAMSSRIAPLFTVTNQVAKNEVIELVVGMENHQKQDWQRQKVIQGINVGATRRFPVSNHGQHTV